MHLKTDTTSAKLTKQIHNYNVHQSPLVLEPSFMVGLVTDYTLGRVIFQMNVNYDRMVLVRK